MKSATVVGVVFSLGLAASAHGQQFVGNCSVLPPNNIWNTPVDTLPVLSNSTAMVNTIGANRGFHADLGSGTWDGGPIGIPFVTVNAGQASYPASFLWPDEADPGPYAIPLDAPIEGGPNATGDRHAIAIDTDRCILYELSRAFPQAASWVADAGAIFDLKSNALRPLTWTTADAAGLPIMPGLVTYEEVLSGEIRHAIRFTAPQTRHEFVWPARHYASSLTGSQYPRMGERFRLKASFDITPYPSDVQVILRAMKKYGIMLADNGTSWYISGKPDPRWNNTHLHTFGQLLGSNFEAVDATVLMVDPNSGEARQSHINRSDFDGDGRAEIAVYRPGSGNWIIRYSSKLYSTATAATFQWGAPGDVSVTGDFDGDRRVDLTVFRPNTAEWYVRDSSHAFNSYRVYQWGAAGDVPVAADFDGDRKTDFCVYRPTTGQWYLRNSSGSYGVYGWGASGDVPLAADFDGDRKTDFCVYRPTTGQWYLRNSSGSYGVYGWGASGDVPLAADFDGDGRAELTVFRPSTAQWFVRYSSQGYNAYGSFQWGASGDVPLAADFDGDRKTDLVAYRPATGQWFIRLSSQGYSYTSAVIFGWGLAGDVPLVIDFDGDRKAELAVYRPTTGEWYVRLSSQGFNAYGLYQWGLPGDLPLPPR